MNKFYVSVENNLNFITNEKYKIQIETDIKSNNVKILQIEFQTLLYKNSVVSLNHLEQFGLQTEG